jgi:hypothetical protein
MSLMMDAELIVCDGRVLKNKNGNVYIPDSERKQGE